MQNRTVLYIFILCLILSFKSFSQEIILKSATTGTIFEAIQISSFEYNSFPEKHIISKAVWIAEKLGPNDEVSLGGIIPGNLPVKVKNWGFKFYGMNDPRYRVILQGGWETDRYNPSEKYVWWDHVKLPIETYTDFVVEFYINQRLINQVEVKYKPLETTSYEQQSNVKNNDGFLRANQIINKYINAIGGKENILKIRDRTIKMTGSINGTNLSITICNKAPNKFYQLIDFGSGQQKIVFDGSKGKSSMMGKEKDYTGDQLESLKLEAEMYAFLDYPQYGIKTELGAIETMNNDNAYPVILTMPSGKKNIQYYDVNSGLLIRQVTTNNTSQGNSTSTTDLEDYRDVEGVKIPYKIIQSTPSGTVELTTTSVEVNKGIEDSIFGINDNAAEARPYIPQYESTNLTGMWTGTAIDETGPGKMTLYLEQKDKDVHGDVIVTNDRSGTTFSGKVNGEINSKVFLGEMVFTIAGCNIKVRFNSYLQENKIIGNYDSQSNCAEQVKDGRLNLLKAENNRYQEPPNYTNNSLAIPNENKIKSDLIGKSAMTQYGLWVFSSLDEIKGFTIKDNKVSGNLLEFTIDMRLSDGHIVHVAMATVNYKLINGSWEIYNVEFRRFY